MSDKTTFMYVSLWNEHGGAPGLALYTFNSETGEIAFKKKINDTISFNCSFIDHGRNILYVCNETPELPDVDYPCGRIYGYRIDPQTGDLTEFFKKDTLCPNPSYITLDKTGRYMVAAHHSTYMRITKIVRNQQGKFIPQVEFNDSVVELIEVNEDGSLGDIVDVKKHVPDVPVFDRRGRPSNSHPHSAVMSPSGKFFAVCDKGDGYVYMYRIDYDKKELVLCDKKRAGKPGNAPRYCVFHPSSPYLFVNHERAFEDRMNICSFSYDENDGHLEKVGEINVLPEGFRIPEGSNYEQQGFCMHPSGKYVYSILNGHNAVAVLEADERTGRLKHLENVEIEGTWPRGIAIHKSGRFLVTGCLVSGDIAVYSVGDDGRLSRTGYTSKMRGCSYITFY